MICKLLKRCAGLSRESRLEIRLDSADLIKSSQNNGNPVHIDRI